jgi:hypothetical protein
VFAVGGFAWVRYQSAEPMRVTLRFHPFVGDEVLTLNEVRYANPGGQGRFKIRDFQFFVSNIRLVGPSGLYTEPESYHLARFDDGDGTYTIELPGVPRRDYEHIEFGIGVDASANGSITIAGDLDPNSRMAWSWDVGYKFVLFEGGLVIGDTQYPLVYHIGFDENYVKLTIPAAGLAQRRDVRLAFRVDILRVFDGPATVDMVALPNVKFDKTDAKLLADNYAGMVTICSSNCVP